jgi:2-iminobutanoate/2-iminopropanoate deaminase
MPKEVPDAPSSPQVLGPYSAVTQANGFVFVSGQVALDPETRAPVGEDAPSQARRVLENIGLILGDVGLGYDDVVKTSVFLADIGDFAAVNEVYRGFFGDEPPARSAFQVGALPGGFLVEIEAIAAR